MCGIVGLQLRDGPYQGQLGELIAAMLAEVRERGPDSAGVALYGDAQLCRPGWAAATVLAGQVPASDLAALVTRQLTADPLAVGPLAGPGPAGSPGRRLARRRLLR